MTRIPAINHLCWVVDDLDDGIAFWTDTLRVGPFFVTRHVPWVTLEVEGRPAEIDMSAAYAWNGAVQIELIQIHDDRPSVFTLYPAVNGGVQHVGIRTDDPDGVESVLAQAGMRRVQSGVNAAGTVATYMHGGPSAGVIEVIGLRDAGAYLEKMKQAARNWDGITRIANQEHSMRQPLYTVTEDTFQVGDGLSIAYSDYRPSEDKGLTPIVYLPGFMRTARDFDRVAPRFADERRIITIDTRGRGKAARAIDASAYHFDKLIDDVWALTDHLGIGRMVLAGLALGAFMSWRMAAARPDRVAGIVVNDTGTETSSPSGKKMIANADHGTYTLDEAAAKLRAAMAHQFPDLGPEDWRVYARQIYADRGQGYVRDFDPLWFEELARFKAETPTLWPEFSMITCPVAILHGEISEYLSAEQARKMADALPDCKVSVVQGRGHSNLLDEPASLGAMRAVLARIDQRG